MFDSFMQMGTAAALCLSVAAFAVGAMAVAAVVGNHKRHMKAMDIAARHAERSPPVHMPMHMPADLPHVEHHKPKAPEHHLHHEPIMPHRPKR